jgi:hypothetical protein
MELLVKTMLVMIFVIVKLAIVAFPVTKNALVTEIAQMGLAIADLMVGEDLCVKEKVVQVGRPTAVDMAPA